MEINNEKLKIAGLVVIGALMILLSRQQHYRLPSIQPQPAPPVELASAQSINTETGIITGELNLPKGNRQAYVCAINAKDFTIYCTDKVTKEYSLAVPTGSYTVYSTVYDNPKDINGYRAYYSDAEHQPIKIEVTAGQTVTQINPNDWSNRGDEDLIAQINALKPPYYPKVAETTEPVQPATPANPYPEGSITPQLVSVDQSNDSGDSGKRHKKNN